MRLEVKQWPDSQEVADDSEWFPVVSANPEKDPIGPSASARVLHDEATDTTWCNQCRKLLNELIEPVKHDYLLLEEVIHSLIEDD